ncbi:MAG: hypothetical protein QF441_03760 [Bacteriovoracaceae bacterium]|jgi:hypothetical protein|nr:hypothetical protein [Halobacteriovoraceae bacterium]MDP7319695.1 hypothetical protein [Bacteriovoracaceae bacterium]|tara:strand:- start:130 stop:531 length:402 start_codon:yes stop_codon:yes gene_type:complete
MKKIWMALGFITPAIFSYSSAAEELSIHLDLYDVDIEKSLRELSEIELEEYKLLLDIYNETAPHERVELLDNYLWSRNLENSLIYFRHQEQIIEDFKYANEEERKNIFKRAILSGGAVVDKSTGGTGPCRDCT